MVACALLVGLTMGCRVRWRAVTAGSLVTVGGRQAGGGRLYEGEGRACMRGLGGGCHDET
jgi:hypothetical protein